MSSYSPNLVDSPSKPGPQWFLLWIAVIVAVVWLALPMRPNAPFDADGEPHAVNVIGWTGPSMIWLEQGRGVPTCEIIDLDTRRGLGQRPVVTMFHRANSEGGEWLGAHTFPSGSGHLQITCTSGDKAASRVQVGAAPRLAHEAFGSPNGLIGMGAAGGVGLLGLGVVTLRAFTRPSEGRH